MLKIPYYENIVWFVPVAAPGFFSGGGECWGQNLYTQMGILGLLLVTHNARKSLKIDGNKGFLIETRNHFMVPLEGWWGRSPLKPERF